MKRIKNILLKYSLLLFLLTLFSGAATGQIPDEILLSLKSGDAKQLSGHFNQNVELVILEDENVYSRAQAQQIVANFFNQYSPERFSVIHQGGKEGARYVIGNLTTNSGNFRVYFLLKNNNNNPLIHQLRIEKQ